MAPKQDVSEDRRAQILDAAAKVFSKKGFSGSRMDDIVEASGLSKGLLYWYFKSKDAIIVALLDRLVAGEMGHIGRLPTEGGSARERLARLSHKTVKELNAMNKLLPITFDYYSLASRNKAVKKLFKGYMETYYRSFSEVISQGVRAGEFSPVDERVAGIAFGAIIEGTILLWLFDRESIKIGEQIETATELFLRGLEAKVPGGTA